MEIEQTPNPEPHNLTQSPIPEPVARDIVTQLQQKHQPIEQQEIKGEPMDIFIHTVFRLGFASIFLVNAIVATFRPQEFVGLLQNNIIASRIGHFDLMMNVALINDLLLGVFILLGKYKRLVYPWAGAWLLLVAGMKLMNLVF